MAEKHRRESDEDAANEDEEDEEETNRGLSKKSGKWRPNVNRDGLRMIVCIFCICLVIGMVVYFGAYFDHSTTTHVEPASVAASESDSSDDIRLPTYLIPDSYFVRLRPNLTGSDPSAFHFNGTVRIQFNVTQSTGVLTLHVKNLSVDHRSITVFSPIDGAIEVLNVSTDPVKEFLHVQLNGQLRTQDLASIYLEFSGPIRSDLAGIYYSSYEMDGITKYLLTSHLHPTEARKVFPCFDEPQLKSKFNVTLEKINDAKVNTLSNTVIYSQEETSDGWIADHYAESPPMSTYLLAFVVSEFSCLNTTSRNKPVLVCARPNAVQQGQFALSISAPLQEFYEDYYNISYPMPKTAHAAIPDFPAGAMENWGLILYRESSLLYDSLTSSASNKQRVATVVAHELAHMWFGNLVTPSWWDDIWLNEGFASYMEYPSVEKIFPDWEMEKQFLTEALHLVMKDDSLATSHPIYQEVHNPVEINELFDSISYEKGASVIRMTKYFLGEEVFRVGVTNYLKEKSYSVSNHTDLFNALTKESQRVGDGVDVNAVLSTWTLQMGYPVVHFSYEPGSGRIALRQKHFLLDADANVTAASPYNYTWIVPISVTTSRDRFQNFTKGWLNSTAGEIETTKEAKWIIGNVFQCYYYRVNYDDDMWFELTSQLIEDHTVIVEMNRAQIIDDSFNLGRSGDVDQLLAMNITLYLVREFDYTPWATAATDLDYINRMLMFSSNYSLMQDYMQQQVSPVYSEVGWGSDNASSTDDSHLRILLRVVVIDVACAYQLKDCIDTASTQFNEWQSTHPLNLIDVNLREVVYCYGTMAGGVSAWNFTFERYLESNVASEQTTFLEALACTTDVTTLQRYLDMAFQETLIRRQDFATVIVSVAENRYGKTLAWNMLRDEWDTIYERFGTTSLYTLSHIVTGVTKSFSTETELRELEDFVLSNEGQLGSSERAFQQAIESTELNIEWRKKNEGKVFGWLHEH